MPGIGNPEGSGECSGGVLAMALLTAPRSMTVETATGGPDARLRR
ncbi:hypothetical protein BN2497_643 [Janthinobacterium sp. CG23_2]|nr:hypothetical protein BN2497_643 [Janthinobacterium sp. CG23_2]CUU26719.1 hypothetical protein BN3177_643 [Janthinobacterium sp. CG23_2]